MALGNLSVKVSADISGFTSNMQLASQAANDNMMASQDAIEGFRQSLLQSTADMKSFSAVINSNMKAANDSITTNADQAANALTDMGDSMDEAKEKIKEGAKESQKAIEDLNDDAGEKAETLGDKVMGALGAVASFALGFVKSAIETALAVEAALAFSNALGVIVRSLFEIYAIYKAISFVVSMLDISFYKSEDIDAIIAYSASLKELQDNLLISSIQAGALYDALHRLGVDQKEYLDVFSKVTFSIHDNGDELERLGVVTKDANGKFLDQRKVLENAKAVLDSYTEGWDRNRASVAIGMGTYAQITNALKVTDDQLHASKERLNDYQLGMTAGTQEALRKYQTAMREFQNENDLMSQGFKRVMSDALVPAFTAMMNYLKNGWPSVVNLFRVGVSTIVGLVYGIVDGIYIFARSIVAIGEVIGGTLISLGKASLAVMQGDFKKAGEYMTEGWSDAKDRVNDAGKEIVDVIMKNDAAIKQAVGDDGRDASLAASKRDIPEKKSWVPPDKKEKESNKDVAKSVMEGKIKEQEALIASEKAILQSRESYLKTYYANDEMSAEEYYSTKNRAIVEAKNNIEIAYKAEIAAAEQYISINEKIKGNEKEVEEGKNRIIEAKKKRAADEMALNNQITQSYMELAAEAGVIQKEFLTNAEAEDKMYASRMSKIQAFKNAQIYNEHAGNRMLEQEGRRHSESVINAAIADERKKQDLNVLFLTNSANTADQVKGYWLAANQSVLTDQQKLSQMTAQAMTSATDGVASAVTQFINHGKSLGESLKNVAVSIADSFVQSFIKMQIQKLLLDKVAATGYVATITAQSQAMVAMASLAAFASTAAIPIVGPGLAPAAAATAAATAEGFSTAAIAAATLSVPSARNGYDIPTNVNPLTQLHEQEMVLPKEQANVVRDLAKSSSTTQQSSTGPIELHTTINIHPDGNSSSNTSGKGVDTGAAKQLSDMVNGLTQQALAKEMRPGGLIWKMRSGQV
ncbi:hypothetical protein ACO0K2_11760 [Undibacterium sp. MH2W]|uniref:hypothetical protein n=1 Tax=Undibacterium sp. MH2W TaxID=3413044 RepID=UPI003BF25528